MIMYLWVLGGVVIFVTVSLWLVHRARQIHAQFERRMLELSQRLNAASASAMGMGQRIIALEAKLQSLNDLALDTASSDRAAYTQAMQLLDRGVDINTVTASCSISSSEASLLALMREKTSNKPARAAPV